MPAGDKLPLAKNRSEEITAEDAVRVLGDAAMAAGRLARTMREKGLKTWVKGKDSPVSDADIAADALLRERLTAAAPHYEWLSEESAEIAGKVSHRRAGSSIRSTARAPSSKGSPTGRCPWP